MKIKQNEDERRVRYAIFYTAFIAGTIIGLLIGAIVSEAGYYSSFKGEDIYDLHCNVLPNGSITTFNDTNLKYSNGANCTYENVILENADG